MMGLSPAAFRMASWGSATAVAGAITGLQWAGQTVQVPIAWLLLLTFIPTETFVRAFQARMPEPEGGGN